jgi:hypothetical protein
MVGLQLSDQWTEKDYGLPTLVVLLERLFIICMVSSFLFFFQFLHAVISMNRHAQYRF